MKIAVISTPTEAAAVLERTRGQGYITFMYHHADPKHELLPDKFLYVHSDEELKEKVTLLKEDVSIRDLIQR